MEKIFFPANYKKALLEGKKNITVRINEEFGKYKKGKKYIAYSYAGKNWNVVIQIQKVQVMKIDELARLKIPKLTVNKIKKESELKYCEVLIFVLS